MKKERAAHELAEVFDKCFAFNERTRMVIGVSEPYFVPANTEAYFSCGECITASDYARVFSRKDYAASVLHEAAHWCIAGLERRQQLDYGYWYEPDGRSAEQQALFESVEVKPQALEWVMSLACGMPFRVSADNANAADVLPSTSFRQNIYAQARTYIEHGLPERAARFAQALDSHFGLDKRYTNLSSYVYGDLV